MDRVTYFFYGTLMDAAIARRVTGLEVTAARLRPAVLDGYRRVRVADQHYPALVPLEGGRVEGCLLRNVPSDAQRRLAIYEDATYEPRWVTAKGVGGMKVKALAFVAGPAMTLTDEDWDFEAWCKTHRRPFLMGLERWTKEVERSGRAADVLR